MEEIKAKIYAAELRLGTQISITLMISRFSHDELLMNLRTKENGRQYATDNIRDEILAEVDLQLGSCQDD